MDYSNMQFLFTVILDGLLGILCGWSLRRWLHLEGTAKTEAALQQGIVLIESRLRIAAEDLVLAQNDAALSRGLLSEARATLQQTAAQLKSAEVDAATFKRMASDTEAGWAACNRDLMDARTALSELDTAAVEKARRMAALEMRVAELEPLVPNFVSAELHSARMPGARNELEFRKPVSEPNDDLKEIFGIGPVCERKLNAAGVRLFSQIAAWTKEDVDRFKVLLPKSRDRIVRDKWVESARVLHEAKCGRMVMRRAS
jgi:predicted flap endonuclease-1-like 5' DNA nuclease